MIAKEPSDDYQLPLQPCHVIDIRDTSSQNSDYTLSCEDMSRYEKKYGSIQENSIVIAFSGWSDYWSDEKQYLNQDEKGTLHFPEFSEKSASFLIDRGISGIGIDTMSLDPGCDLTFPAALPPQGALIIALPVKIAHGPESPARVVALCPKTAI